jgi:lipopolysaccharide heptosyltransferase I
MNRLLVVKLSSFGDILHALPVVKSIKADLPELSIGWVVRERCAGLVKNCEFLDRVHIMKDKPAITDLLRLRRELRLVEYDVAFDMQGLLLSGLVTFLSGAKRRIGLNRNREMNKLFLTEATVEGKVPLTHAVDVQLGFRRALGLKQIDTVPSLSHLGGASEEWLLSLKKEIGGKSAVVLNVGASTLYKRWPNERWIGLANTLIDQGAHILLTAGPSEAADAHVIADNISVQSSVTDLGGRTTPEQLAAILGASDLVISGDTGPMHLAAALGTQTIALFGPTDPRLTGPYGSAHKTIWKQIECSPCFRHPTCSGRVDCLREISSEEVSEMAIGMLGRQPRGVLL